MATPKYHTPLHYALYDFHDSNYGVNESRLLKIENGVVSDISSGMPFSSYYPRSMIKIGSKVFIVLIYDYSVHFLDLSNGQIIESFQIATGENFDISTFIKLIDNKIYYSKWNNSSNSNQIVSFDGTNFEILFNLSGDNNNSHIGTFHQDENSLIISVETYDASWSNSTVDFYVSTNLSSFTKVVENVPRNNSLGEIDPYNKVKFFNNKIYFVANVSGQEKEYVVVDSSGYRILKDFRPGSPSSVTDNRQGLVSANGLLYLSPVDPFYGLELFASNGSDGNAVLVADINAKEQGMSSGFVDYGQDYFTPVNINGALIFAAHNGSNGIELWRTDGTTSGTYLLKDINPGPGDSRPAGGFLYNNEYYFVATDGVTGIELYKTDGTSSGTVRLTDANPNGDGAYIQNRIQSIIGFEGSIYFPGRIGYLAKILRYNISTGIVTELEGNNFPISGISPYTQFSVVGDKLVFPVSFQGKGYELGVLRPDGKVDLIKDINTTNNGNGIDSTGGHRCPLFCYVKDNVLYFTGRADNSRHNLWRTDGTEEGTYQLLTSTITSISSREFFELNGKLMFYFNNGTTGETLYTSDGTPEGSLLLKEFNIGSASDRISERSTQIINNKAYAILTISGRGTEIIETDGTTAGTNVIELFPGTNGLSSNTGNITWGPGNYSTSFKYKNRMIFRHYNNITGLEFYFFDPLNGNKFEILGDAVPGNANTGGSILGTVGNKLIMTYPHPTFGVEIYSYEK